MPLLVGFVPLRITPLALFFLHHSLAQGQDSTEYRIGNLQKISMLFPSPYTSVLTSNMAIHIKPVGYKVNVIILKQVGFPLCGFSTWGHSDGSPQDCFVREWTESIIFAFECPLPGT